MFQFKQLQGRSLKNIRASTGFEPVTSVIPVRCSTNWTVKPHFRSEVKLLSSYHSVQWHMHIYFTSSYCTGRYELRCEATHWERGQFAEFISSVQWNDMKFICICHWTGRYELNKLTSLQLCGFTAQLVEYRTGIAEVTGSNSVEAPLFFQAYSFQLLKLEYLLRWSLFKFIDNRNTNMNFIYISHHSLTL